MLLKVSDKNDGALVMKTNAAAIQSLIERVSKRQYERYLNSIRLINVRAFSDQVINFSFPVTAVIGTNGGGKSTVLGGAALGYKTTKPGDHFPKSNIGDTSMSNWRIEYDILDRGAAQKGTFTRNARFVSAKWRRDDITDRNVILFPIQRTVPAGEQTRYKKFIGIYQHKNAYEEALPEPVCLAAGYILGKDLSKFKIAKFSKGSSEYILLGMQKKNDYSQFHFGAGEASIIEMVTKIEAADNEALILIEEIENGLHPVATERMVEYLIDAARRKRLQVIFTTHSDYALRKLPPEAIWACIDGEAYQGRLSIESLRAITGHAEKEKVIFVEDDFGKDWVEDLIRQRIPDGLSAVEIHAAGGYPHLVDVTNHHNKNPSLKKKAVAVVDGDMPIDATETVLKFPGGMPEMEIFGFISEHAAELAGLIQQRCLCPNLDQGILTKKIEKTIVNVDDRHLIFRKLGDELGFISEDTIRKGLISIYNEKNQSSSTELVAALRSFIGAK